MCTVAFLHLLHGVISALNYDRVDGMFETDLRELQRGSASNGGIERGSAGPVNAAQDAPKVVQQPENLNVGKTSQQQQHNEQLQQKPLQQQPNMDLFTGGAPREFGVLWVLLWCLFYAWLPFSLVFCRILKPWWGWYGCAYHTYLSMRAMDRITRRDVSAHSRLGWSWPSKQNSSVATP